MKPLTRIVVTVLSLACIVFLAIAMFKPQLGEELQTNLEDIPEGDYWVVMQITPDEMREPYHMP